MSASQAAAEIDAIGKALASEYPEQNAKTGLRLASVSPVPGSRGMIAGFMALLLALVGLILAIACANLTGVLLARAAARRRELGMRVALGAARGRLVRQLLAEMLLLFSIGGIVGLLVTRSLLSSLMTLLPTLPFPIDLALAVDSRVILFTAGLILSATLISGLAPALQGSKTDVLTALKEDLPAPRRLRLRNAFVVTQVASSVLLVVIAGLFARALLHVGSLNPGFEPGGVELASLDLGVAGYTDDTGPLFARDIIERVRQSSVVQDATVAAVLPGGFEGIGLGSVRPTGVQAGDERLFPDWNATGAHGGGCRTRPALRQPHRRYNSLYVYRPLQQEYVPGWTMLVVRSTHGGRIEEG